MKSVYREFSEEMIPEAGALLARRHQANRRQMPLLSPRFEDAAAAAEAVQGLWKSKSKLGYAAFCDGRLTAYLIGEIVVQEWGRYGYVYLPGCALAEDESPETIKDLYSALGDAWLQRGAFSHGIYVCAADQRLTGALFDIGFGKEGVDALLDLEKLSIPEIIQPEKIVIRKAGPGDNEHLGGLSGIIYHALGDAPYWLAAPPEVFNDLRDGWSELADDKDWSVWLALEDETALGMIGFAPERGETKQMLLAPQTIHLSVAATKPEARGRGISTWLSWHGLEQMRLAGYKVCLTNWVSSNLLAARHWPRYGFKDAAYRLSKRVNPDIAWTRSQS